MRLPVGTNETYTVRRIDKVDQDSQVIRPTALNDDAIDLLVFDSGPLPPAGAAIFQVSMSRQDRGQNPRRGVTTKTEQKPSFLQHGTNNHVDLTNGKISARFEK